MAELENEKKPEGEKKTESDSKAVVKGIVGILLVVLGVVLWIYWLKDFLSVLKGCIGPFLVLAGTITIAIARE